MGWMAYRWVVVTEIGHVYLHCAGFQEADGKMPGLLRLKLSSSMTSVIFS